MKHILCLALLLLCAARHQAQPLRVMEWNVENMFHPSDNPQADDEAFTPDGKYAWTYSRFMTKCNLLAQTMAACSTSLLPDMVALCEVEDDSTLIALTRFSLMRTIGYKYVMTHGSDARGINVALIYSPARFRPLTSREVRVPSVEHGYTPTRNILYVAGEVLNRHGALDTLHVVVCHLPSQAGGTRAADRHRRLAAECLMSLCDSVVTASPKARLLVTGDFNSDARSSVMRYLESAPFLRMVPANGCGTYRYRGFWSYLDHVLCSPSLSVDSVRVLQLPHLLRPNRSYGGEQPFRTFLGSWYNGGVSDHLPLCFEVRSE